MTLPRPTSTTPAPGRGKCPSVSEAAGLEAASAAWRWRGSPARGRSVLHCPSHPPLCSRLLAARRCLSCFSAARSIGWGTLRGFGRPQGFPPASAPASPARPSQPCDPQGVVSLLPVLTSRLCRLPARSLSPPEPQCPHHNRLRRRGPGPRGARPPRRARARHPAAAPTCLVPCLASVPLQKPVPVRPNPFLPENSGHVPKGLHFSSRFI